MCRPRGTSLAEVKDVKLLWVKAGKLLPVDTGGKIRSYNLLRHLAARHDVTLLSYYGGPADPTSNAGAGRYFPFPATFPRSPPAAARVPVPAHNPRRRF